MKAKYTSVPVQYDVRRSQQKQEDGRTTQRSTKHTKQTKTRTKTPRQQDKPKPAKTPDNMAGRQDPTKRGCRGKKASGDQQKRKEQAPGKAAEAGGRGQHKPRRRGRCGFIGVLRVFWITQGRIPQCQSEGHMNSTHHMV